MCGAQQGGKSRWRTAASRRSGRVHEGPRRARMPFYGPGSKYLDRTEKETEWRRFHAPQLPGNSHCAPTAAHDRANRKRARRVREGVPTARSQSSHAEGAATMRSCSSVAPTEPPYRKGAAPPPDNAVKNAHPTKVVSRRVTSENREQGKRECTPPSDCGGVRGTRYSITRQHRPRRKRASVVDDADHHSKEQVSSLHGTPAARNGTESVAMVAIPTPLSVPGAKRRANRGWPALARRSRDSSREYGLRGLIIISICNYKSQQAF